MATKAENVESDESPHKFCFDFPSQPEGFSKNFSNQSNRADIMKKYLVYMELPKIRIGDYRKSSCVSGSMIRFHFLLRIARDEANTALRLVPIKAYKAPVVNFAVIHRPFLDDEEAKGPIPKSPGVRSPLIHYADDDAAAPDARTEELVEDFGRGNPVQPEDAKQEPQPQPQQDAPRQSAKLQEAPRQSAKLQEAPRQSAKLQEAPRQSAKLQEAPRQSAKLQEAPRQSAKQPSPRASGRPSQKDDDRMQDDKDDEKQFEVESPSRQPPEPPVSPSRILSDDNLTGQTDPGPAQQPKQRRPKKYFVYCEIPKVLIGDYRNSSVICSEIIHAHFLMKIAKDEESDQPRLQPIRRYHRPKVNFAVIHRSLIVDDEAIGPIPRSPNVKSPMIREDEELVGEGQPDAAKEDGDNILHATMGFCYGRLPRSKYELVSQWSMVPNEAGVLYPELVLSKAEV